MYMVHFGQGEGHMSVQGAHTAQLTSYMGYTLVKRGTWHQGEGPRVWSEGHVELTQVLYGAHTGQ